MSGAGLSPDSQVILLLCSHLALPRTIGDLKPLSRTEWNDLARAIGASPLKRPAALLGASTESITGELGVGPARASRIARLLDRGAQLAVELERLQSLGIWTLTRPDPDYPPLLKERLKGHAPPVLFGAGASEALTTRGIGIVGSRDVDASGSAFASALGALCAQSGLTVFSGGARGVDRLAADGALDEGGRAVAVLADSLQDSLRRKAMRDRVLDGRLTLVTPSPPSARFTVAAAMGRNKLIYALSSAAVVVSSARESGGTWAGAIENLRAGWVPLLVRDGDDVPDGNRELLERGGRAVTLEALGSCLDAVLDEVVDTASGSREAIGLSSAVMSRLAAFLQTPRTRAELADAFHLQHAQADAWLQRAVEQGLVRRLSDPSRFEWIGATDTQASLFE